jgi:hypothetical protein
MMPRNRIGAGPFLLFAAGAGLAFAAGSRAVAPVALVVLAAVAGGWTSLRDPADRPLAALQRWNPGLPGLVATGLLLSPLPLGYFVRLHHFTFGPMKFDTGLRAGALLGAATLLLCAPPAAQFLLRDLPGRLVAPFDLVAGSLLVILPLSRWAIGGQDADREPALGRIALLSLAAFAAAILAARRDRPAGGALVLASHLAVTLFLFGDPDADHPSLAQVVGAAGSWTLRVSGAIGAVLAALFVPDIRRRPS